MMTRRTLANALRMLTIDGVQSFTVDNVVAKAKRTL